MTGGAGGTANLSGVPEFTNEPHLIWKIDVSKRKILIFKAKSIYIENLTKRKDWVVRNHDYVSECSDMSTFRMLSQ
jgi:hypothetical protein